MPIWNLRSRLHRSSLTEILAMNFRRSVALFLLLVACTRAATLRAADAAPSPADLDFFETKIRPVLVEKCYSCHSSEAKELQAGLFVDSREGLLKGGDTGLAVVPGKPEESLLIESLKYE